MNKSTSRKNAMNSPVSELDSDDSLGCRNLEQQLLKIIDSDSGPRTRRKKIFTDEVQPAKLRPSVVQRALKQHVFSSTPTTKYKRKFFSSEASLNLSPIGADSLEPNKENTQEPPNIIVISDSPPDKIAGAELSKNEEDKIPEFDENKTLFANGNGNIKNRSLRGSIINKSPSRNESKIPTPAKKRNSLGNEPVESSRALRSHSKNQSSVSKNLRGNSVTEKSIRSSVNVIFMKDTNEKQNGSIEKNNKNKQTLSKIRSSKALETTDLDSETTASKKLRNTSRNKHSETNTDAGKNSKIPIIRTRSQSRDKSGVLERNNHCTRNQSKGELDEDLEESQNKTLMEGKLEESHNKTSVKGKLEVLRNKTLSKGNIGECNQIHSTANLDQDQEPCNKCQKSSEFEGNDVMEVNEIQAGARDLIQNNIQKDNGMEINEIHVTLPLGSVGGKDDTKNKKSPDRISEVAHNLNSGYVSEKGTEVTEKLLGGTPIITGTNTEFIDAGTSPLYSVSPSSVDSEVKKRRLNNFVAKIVKRKSLKALDNVEKRTSIRSYKKMSEFIVPKLQERQTQTSFRKTVTDKLSESNSSDSNISNCSKWVQDSESGNIFESIREGSIVERFSSFYNYNVIDHDRNEPWRFDGGRDSSDGNYIKPVYEFIQKQRRSQFTRGSNEIFNEKSGISKSTYRKSTKRKYARSSKFKSPSTTCKDDNSEEEDIAERISMIRSDSESDIFVEEHIGISDKDDNAEEENMADKEDNAENERTLVNNESQTNTHLSPRESVNVLPNQQSDCPKKHVIIPEKKNEVKRGVDEWLTNVHESLRKSGSVENTDYVNINEGTNDIIPSEKEDGNVEQLVQNEMLEITIQNKRASPMAPETNKRLSIILNNMLSTHTAEPKSRSRTRKKLSANFSGFEDLATSLNKVQESKDVSNEVQIGQLENDTANDEENIEVPKKKGKTAVKNVKGSTKNEAKSHTRKNLSANINGFEDLAIPLDNNQDCDDVPNEVRIGQTENKEVNDEETIEVPKNREITGGKNAEGSAKNESKSHTRKNPSANINEFEDLSVPLNNDQDCDDVRKEVQIGQTESKKVNDEENIEVPKKKGITGAKNAKGTKKSTKSVPEKPVEINNGRPVRTRRPPKRRYYEILTIENPSKLDRKLYGILNNVSGTENKTRKKSPVKKQPKTKKKDSQYPHSSSESEFDKVRNTPHDTTKDEPNKPSQEKQEMSKNKAASRSKTTKREKPTSKKSTAKTRSRSKISEKSLENSCQFPEMVVIEHTVERNEDFETNDTGNGQTNLQHIHEQEMIDNDHLLNSNYNQTEPTNNSFHDHFLRPRSSKQISHDSGTSTLLKSSMDDINLKSIDGRSCRNEKTSRKTRNVLSNSNLNRLDESTKDNRMSKRTSHFQTIVDDYINVPSDDGSSKIKFVEKNAEFTAFQDNLNYSDALDHPAGSSIIYLKVPPGERKRRHVCKRHNLFYIVMNGKGRVHVQDRVSTVINMSRIIIPVGSSYAIINDSETDDLLLACVRVPAT